MGLTFHAPWSVGECEGMNFHTPKVNSHFGSWSFDGLLNFQSMIVGVKNHWIKKFLISLKRSWNIDV
jgi:hypothetical protein